MNRRPRSGQSTVEYVLLIAVLVVGLAVAAYAFIPGFREGAEHMGDDAAGLLTSGTANGSGNMR